MEDHKDYNNKGKSSLKNNKPNVDFDEKENNMSLSSEQITFKGVSETKSQESNEYFVELIENEVRSITSKNETDRHDLYVISTMDREENKRLSRDSISIVNIDQRLNSIDSVSSFPKNLSICSQQKFGEKDTINGTGNRFIF